MSTRRAVTLIVDAAQLAAAAAVVARLARGARRLPPAEPRPDRLAAPAPGAIGVVIPARNEAARIGPGLAALAADPQIAEVIVVDDESTDATAETARAAGARVVAGRPLPPGWVGKPWALQQGLEAATTDWVLTLDADVVTDAGLGAALVDTAVAHGWDLVSAAPRFVCRDGAQRALHASMLATIVYRFGAPGTGPGRRPGRAVGNGQCVLIRRRWLLDRGGFAVSGGHMTDDIALVRWLAASGAAFGFVDGSRLASVEMHANVAEVWREWGRSLPMPDVTRPWDQAADLATVWLAMAVPVLRLVARRATPLDKALLAVRIGLIAALRGAYEQRGAALWLSWFADPATALRFTTGTLRPARTWRGRAYG